MSLSASSAVLSAFVVALAVVIAFAFMPRQADAKASKEVFVTNPSLPVEGTVDVGNLPETYPVTGEVTVSNMPAAPTTQVATSTFSHSYVLGTNIHTETHDLADFTHITSIALVNPQFTTSTDTILIDFEDSDAPGHVHYINVDRAKAAILGGTLLHTFPYPIPVDDGMRLRCRDGGDVGSGCYGTVLITGLNLS